MPDVDLGALTIPIFATIFTAGWGSCYAILVRPLQTRQDKLESRLTEIEKAKDAELAELRRKVMGL